MGRETQERLLCDFDGTIVTIDTAESVLDRFVDKSWRILDEQFNRGEMSFEESLRREFRMITTDKEKILEYLDHAAQFRPNFEQLVKYCNTESLPLTVVSGGIDFCIQHFISSKQRYGRIDLYAPTSQQTPNGIELTFPKPFSENSLNFKADLTQHLRHQGYTVWYIGNGVADLPAAKAANFAFAVKSSSLHKLCEKENVPHKEFTDFQEVIASLVAMRANPQ